MEAQLDIFTEPDPDPVTLRNLGPLTAMAGTFEGDRGEDLHPAVGGLERAAFLERYDLQPIDPQTNGPQLFYGLRYHIAVVQPGSEGTFHDQVGYWLWEPATNTVIQTLAIPRGQIAMASGTAEPDATTFTLHASRGSGEYGICTNPFLDAAFTTHSYAITVTINADGSWSYEEDTVLEVLGQAAPFHHLDRNTLHRVAPPEPNPLARLAQA